MIGEWYKSLSRPSPKVVNLKAELQKLRPEYLEILNNLMNKLVAECPKLEILPVGGYYPYGFHIKLGNQISSDEFDVLAMIIPQKTKGIKVRARRSPGQRWERKIVDKQRLFEKMVTTSEDIDRFLIYCMGLQ